MTRDYWRQEWLERIELDSFVADDDFEIDMLHKVYPQCPQCSRNYVCTHAEGCTICLMCERKNVQKDRKNGII